MTKSFLILFRSLLTRKQTSFERAKDLRSMQQELQKATKDDLESKNASHWLIGLHQKRYALLLEKDVVFLEKEQALQVSAIEVEANATRAKAEIPRISEKVLEQNH